LGGEGLGTEKREIESLTSSMNPVSVTHYPLETVRRIALARPNVGVS